MNVCINEQSIKDFVKLFKSQAKLINNKTIQSKEQLYKRLYNAALMKSGDANKQSNIDLVVQHMLFLPIALNGSFPGLNIEADLAKTMTAMNSTKAVSDLIKDYQKLIVDTIDVEENLIEYNDENIVDFSKFNPVHVEVLTNQTPEFTGTEKKLDPNQTEAFAFIRAIIGNVKELTETPYKVLAIKLGAANALLNKLGLEVDRSLIGGSVTSPQALVFLMTDANGKIIPYNTKTNKNRKVVLFSSYTNTPELLFEGYDYKKPFNEQKGFADTTANKKIRNVQEKLAKAIKFNNKEMESGEAMKMAFVQLANEFQILNDINKKANQNKAEGFLLDVNPTTSNFGYIDQNSGKETKITDVKDYNQFDVTTKQELTENGKVKFEFFALTGHTLHDVPVSLYPTSLDTNPELINALVELLTNPNLAVNGAVQTDEQRMDLFKKYVNVDSKTPIKFKKDNSISVGSKSFKLFDEGLKEALTDHFTKFSVKQEFVGKTEGKNIITSIDQAKSKNDIFQTASGKFHTVGKPNFSFKIKPENTYKMEGDNLILTPISRNAHIINNSYTIAETTADNELRVYHPRIGFSLGTAVPVTAEKEVELEVEDEVTPAEDVEPTSPTFEEFDDYADDDVLASNTIELETVTEKAEAAALSWFKAHDMKSELDLDFSDKKHPHALAQWFTSGITLYKGSNNTLIYHEAWHAFTQGILTKEQKNKLYFEVKKSYPNENFKNDKEVEEFLAEKFRAYATDKISPKGNLLQQFFKNLLDAITKIFKRKTLTDKYFKDLVDNKVDFTKYNPEANMFWGRMNASITAFSDPKNGKLDAAQSKLIVDTVNTLVNEAYSEKIKNGNMKITTLDDITPLYKHAKTRLIELKENQLKVQEELSKVSNPDAAQKMKIAQVAKQVEALTFSIAEFGNLDDIEKNISETGANTGVIGAHISSGLFITQQGLKSIAEEDTDRDETDPFKERKDISLEEYADKEILMLLSTVPDFDEKGNKVTNALGVHLLSNKVKVLSIVAKQTMSSANPDTMFATLKASKDPIIQEVLKRMPLVNGELPIHLGSQILWSKFFQTFSKSNMPLKQLLFERVNDGKEVGINLKYGSVSSSTTQVRNNWNTAFESTPNIDVDIHGPYLNVKKALEWLEANPKATPAQKFNALGVNITDTKEVNKVLKEGNKDSGIPAGILDDFITRLKNDTSINTTDFEKRINNITDLIKDYSVKNIDDQGNESYEKVKGLGGFYKTLQEVEFKYSNNYNSFMGTNAEGETASELVLNSSITHMINEMNNAETLPGLISNNAFEHLDGNVDPFKKANSLLSEMFDEDGNRQTTKQGNVKLEYENFSGTKYFEKIIGDNEFENIVERGLSNMSLDENSKFITDVYLSYFGKAEAPRMADKSSSFHFGLSNYKPTFNLTAAKAIKSQADTNDVMYNALEKYLAAEIVRINTLESAKGNIDKKYKARGQEFFIFDALLTGPTKTNLKDNIKSTNFDEVLSEVRKSRTTLTKEINQYFKEKTDITLKNKKDTFYLAEGVRKELSGNAKTKLSIDESKELLISMFERNQFLNYLNFTTLFLGDPALYDVTKEDFHKRIAGVISTGEGFRHDLSMLETLNTLPFKSGGVVENNKSRNYAQSRIKSGNIKPEKEFRSYDGTVVTAIINDHKVDSIYLDELAKDIKDSLGPYSEMNEADGQGFISFDFYRMLSISQGLWSPVKEAMYNNIVNGAPFDQTRVSEFFESMKLQHFGPVKTDGLPGMAFHKFNLIPLIPNMIKGTKLEDLHDKMMEQGIDYMTFASGSKLTSVSNSESESPNDDYYNKETRETTTDADFKFTPNIIHVKYLKNQIKIHNEFKGKITLPTQMRAILYAGLMNGGVPKDSQQYSQQEWEALSEIEKLKSKDYTWLKKYEDTIDGIVSFKKQELFNELGITEEADISRSSEKLANLIRSELTRSEIDDAQIDFLFNNSALKTDISLALTEGQVSKMLVSLIDKRLTKMKVNGEGLIQMASTMSEKKGSQWKKATTEEQLEYGTNGLRSYYRKDGKVKAMQVKIALQGDFEKLLYIKGKDGKSIATYITKTAKDGTKVKTLDYDTTLGKLNALMVDPVWKKENMDLFIMTTCRIPGQAMNSVEFMEIHSFLPKIAGNVIILPSEIVAKSGADYDVDKLFTMMANLGLYNGSVKKIKALPKEDINELNSKITGLKERISNKKKELFDFIEANKDTLDEKQNLAEIKEARKSLKTAIASTPNKLTTKEKKALAENEKEVASLNAVIDSIYDTLGQKSSLFDELNAMNSELGDLQIRKDGQSIKGLENDLIDVIVERLEREDNYADLVRPNDTNLVDQIAKDLESVVTPFNKYQVVHGNEGAKISASMIFDPSYNRNKQIENSVGKDTLGIGAVINKYFSMFTRMGMYTNIDSNALTLDEFNQLYNAKPGTLSKGQLDLVKSYKNYNLHFPNFNTKTVNGKKVVDLSSLKNNAGEYIPDILGQMINGWVDVAKGGWIFNIQGNKEATPTLLYLFMAGVPVKDAVNFVSVPAIRNYLEAKRVQQGALHVLNQSTTFAPGNKDALLKYKDIDAYKSVVGGLNIDSNTKEIYTDAKIESLNKIMTLSINDNAPINTNAIEASLNTKGLNPLSDDVQFDLLNKFIAYENIAQQITSLTTATTFDTKASSRLNEVRDKQKKLDTLAVSNSALPVDILKRIDSTIVGKFASTDLILKLFSNFSALKNNNALVKAAESKSKEAFDSGVFPEDNINQYQEDFIWYLYQNESNRITDNTYKGINLVEDESIDKYDYKDGELRYNPTFLNELAFGNESLNTIEHRFGSKNAALKFLAEYGSIDSIDLPKDSMHYTMAKKALSDLGINENTIEGKEITPEEYEELIAVAALESKALLASGNRATLMHGPFSYAKRLLEVVSEHGELKGNFKFLQDVRHNYNKYSHNISLANSKETGYSKIYRQELEILKAYGEIPEVQELFEQFDHFAVLQSGIRTSGQFNVTEIIDPAHISNVIGNQYNSILESLNKLNTGEAKNYSVLDLFTELNYPEDYSKRQLQNKRGGSYENDNYFKNEIEYTNKFDLSYLEGVRKIEIAMAKYATSAIIMPYAALSETEDAARQLEYFTALGERNINFDLGLYATAYINSSSEITDPKFVKEYFNKYKNHLDKLNHDNNLTFNIEMKPGVNGLIIAHLESLGYKKHPMLSGNGLYYAMSKVDSMAVSGLYNTQNTFSIKDDSLLSSSNKNEVVKVSIDQLVSKQLSDKYGLEEKYQAHKSLPNANWSEFIKANVIDNVAIESAYKYVVGKVIEKDKSFKSLLANTQDAVLLQGDGQDKLNNMYARALMTARRSLVEIKAVESDPQQKAAVLTTSSGFLSAGTLPGFKRVEAITGAEIFDGEVFNKVESDALYNKLDVEFPKVLAEPAQRDANFANTKSIYFGPIEYKYSTITKAPAEFPSWLNKTVRELEKRMGVIPGYFDTALINRYNGLEQGLGMHTDAEPNLVGKENINPTVLTLSLGAERIFRLEGMSNTPYLNEKVGIPTKHGHVLVMGKDSQIKYKHGIEKNSGQAGIRYSITLRHTPDVNPVGRAVETPVTTTGRKTYSGNVTSLKPNQVFVFGSNPEGKHGKGAAKAAVDNFGAVYGQGEGIQGQSYALPTKDLRVKENNSLKSISPEVITSSIKKLYEIANQNPIKEFLVSDYSGTNLNGYTGQEMADMFNAAGPIPSNIVFNENFDKLISEKPTAVRTENSYQYYGKPYAIVIENGVGVDVVGYKGKAVDKSKLLAKYNENPNVDPQNGKAFRTEPTPVKAEPIPGSKPKANRYELFPGVFANQGQSEAIDKLYNFISSNESEFVLEGAGGTGKTTLIKNLVDELQSKGSVLAIGPTHKAKRVLDKSLNKNKNEDSKIKTVTLASALAIKLNESNGKFEPDTFKRQKGFVPILGADFVIIDEASMLSDEMLSEINEWKKKGAKVIYMGDRAQLPPVGQNTDSKVFGYSNHYMLLEKMRQAATSPIIGVGTVVSNNVKSSKPEVNVITTDMMVNTKDSVSGSELLWEQNEANAINQFVDDVKNSDDPNHAKIVTFNNEKNTSGQSVLNLNIKVRNALYGLDAVRNQFMPGERLVAYDTFGDEAPKFTNGEDLVVVNNTKKTNVKFRIEANSKAKGYRSKALEFDVEYLDLLNEEGDTIYGIPVIANSSSIQFKQEVDALFKTDPQLAYSLLSEFGNLEYGYAITSHKAQGSTYTNTYVMLDNILGNTNLGTPKAKNQSLYVAVSRPTTKLVMVTKTAPLDPKSITVGAEKSKYDNDKIGC